MDACKIEKTHFVGDDDPCCSSIPERLMNANGLALVATGSLSCVRSLYNAAVRIGKQHQFFHCGITKEEYAAGTYGPKILRAVNKALSCENTRYVVIYASCLEILAQMDFDALFEQAENPRNIPIHLLKRGPLVGRYGKLREEVAKILSSFETTEEPIHQEMMDLPPLYPDYNGVCAMLQEWDTHNFLTTAGGCAGALLDVGTETNPYHVNHSRLNDVQIALGCDSLLENGIRLDREANNHPLTCIVGSTTLGFTGLDCEGIANRLSESSLDAMYFPTGGFAAGPVGASEGAMLLAKRVLVPSEKRAELVNILGYSPVIFGGIEKIQHGMEHLEKVGLKCEIWGHGELCQASQSTGASLNWVVSAEGLKLAKFMKEEYQIPYIEGVPVGKCAMLSWRREVNRILGIDEEIPEFETKEENKKQPKICVIGEPMLSRSICNSLRDDLGLNNTSILVYTPGKDIKYLYRDVMPDCDMTYFDNTQTLLTLTEQADVIIADPVFLEYLQTKCLFIPMPYPLISGRRFLKKEYAIFGKKGGLYLATMLDPVL